MEINRDEHRDLLKIKPLPADFEKRVFALSRDPLSIGDLATQVLLRKGDKKVTAAMTDRNRQRLDVDDRAAIFPDVLLRRRILPQRKQVPHTASDATLPAPESSNCPEHVSKDIAMLPLPLLRMYFELQQYSDRISEEMPRFNEKVCSFLCQQLHQMEKIQQRLIFIKELHARRCQLLGNDQLLGDDDDDADGSVSDVFDHHWVVDVEFDKSGNLGRTVGPAVDASGSSPPVIAFSRSFFDVDVDVDVDVSVLSASVHCVQSSRFTWGILVRLSLCYQRCHHRYIAALRQLLEWKDILNYNRFHRLFYRNVDAYNETPAPNVDDNETPAPMADPLEQDEDNTSTGDYGDSDSDDDVYSEHYDGSSDEQAGEGDD